MRHFRCRQLAQFSIDQGQKFIRGFGIALVDGFQNSGNVAQGIRDT